ncbi:MAG: hypothetical protein PHF86_00765 [Candidatus Nanoarchaeia archaeon]|nr:hypothetical protein [Candidatus Nanoarchaeia archaeon]
MKGIKTKLKFEFNIEDDIPELNFEVDMTKEEIKKKPIIIIKKKQKNGRDSSCNSQLF